MREWDSAALCTRMTLSLVHKLSHASDFRRRETMQTEKTKQMPHLVLLPLLHLKYVAQQVDVGNMCTSPEVWNYSWRRPLLPVLKLWGPGVIEKAAVGLVGFCAGLSLPIYVTNYLVGCEPLGGLPVHLARWWVPKASSRSHPEKLPDTSLIV